MPAWSIIEHQNNILFVKRSEKTSRANQWCLPGGSIKPNESAQQACIREALEETSLDIRVKSLVKCVDEQYYFRCLLVEPDQTIKLKTNECSDYAWVNPSQLLSLGMIMDFHTLVPLFSNLGYKIENLEG